MGHAGQYPTLEIKFCFWLLQQHAPPLVVMPRLDEKHFKFVQAVVPRSFGTLWGSSGKKK